MEPIGHWLVYIGLSMQLLPFLVWLFSQKAIEPSRAVGIWDFLVALLKAAPWPVAVGVINVFIGTGLLSRVE